MAGEENSINLCRDSGWKTAGPVEDELTTCTCMRPTKCLTDGLLASLIPSDTKCKHFQKASVNITKLQHEEKHAGEYALNGASQLPSLGG